jgi:N-acetyl-gamma-glutamyl-phosphate reductase
MKVAVVGPTGFAGLELTRVLFEHPRLKPPLLLGREPQAAAASVSHLFPDMNLNGEGTVHPFSWSLIHQLGVDLLFLAAPGEISQALAAEAASHGLLAIDLSDALRTRSRKQAKAAVSDAVRQMNAAYGWSAADGLA